MRNFRRAGKLWRNLFDKQRLDQDLNDELRSYQDMLADENVRSGMNLPDARRRAAVDTGGVEQIIEQVREVRMGFSIETLSRDVRFAVRMLFKQPNNGGGWFLNGVARLKAGITHTKAQEDLLRVHKGMIEARRRELAIRMALGAGQRRILAGVLKEALVMTSLGLAIGVGCGWWSSRLFESLLFGVKATDPATYIAALTIAGGVALIASLLPAIRAARTEPMSALRVE